MTSNFLISKFREYYLQASLEVPPSFQSREWGFLFFQGSGMVRHKSFLSRGELADYIRSMVPAHIYHSTAYYQRPAAPTMKEKLWQGADLIFDLDADHLHKAPKSYKEMLELVKKEALKLLEFLQFDFGFSEKDISAVFSGGRGYHIHIRDRKALKLGSEERREIVDYLSGRGLDIKRFIHQTSIKGEWGVGKASRLRAPAEGAAGWGSRINRSIISFAHHLRGLEEEEAVKALSQVKGIGPKTASSFYRSLLKDDALDEIRQGNLDLFKGSAGIWKKLLHDYLYGQSVGVGLSLDDERGETDEPVTTDVRRLIRCPGSLHGGSGFAAVSLSLKALETFDPLWDAVVFGDKPVPVEINKKFSAEMRGQSYYLDEGTTELPTCVAIFLMARGIAELGKALHQ